MRVELRKPFLDRIRSLVHDAVGQGREIERIVLDREEWGTLLKTPLTGPNYPLGCELHKQEGAGKDGGTLYFWDKIPIVGED